MTLYGYSGQILEVDLSRGKTKVREMGRMSSEAM